MRPTASSGSRRSARSQMPAGVPLIVDSRTGRRGQPSERTWRKGARDTVSLQQPGARAGGDPRELHAARMERTLTIHAARRAGLPQPARRGAAPLERCDRAGAGRHRRARSTPPGSSCSDTARPAALVGQPVMDLFDDETQAPLKGALSACLQGRWSDHVLKAGALLADGSAVPLELVLAGGEFDGEPCVQLIVPATQARRTAARQELADAVQRDPATGLLTRRHLLRCARGAPARSRSPAACATSPACARTNSPRSSATRRDSPARNF